MTTSIVRPLVPALFALATATSAFAQNFHWTGSVANGSRVSVANVNGDVRITASTTGRVEVTGIKRGNGNLDLLRADVQQTSGGLTICVLYDDDSHCDDQHSHSGNRNWNNARMDLEVSVPAAAVVSAASVSGDVVVSGAQGDVEATSVSGDIRLDRLRATSIHANSVSGDIQVQADLLAGNGALSFHSVSGDITLEFPRQFDADISMSTVSGALDSDYQMTVGNGRMNRRSIDARIGGGGRRLDLNTVSGDVKLRMGSR